MANLIWAIPLLRLLSHVIVGCVELTNLAIATSNCLGGAVGNVLKLLT